MTAIKQTCCESWAQARASGSAPEGDIAAIYGDDELWIHSAVSLPAVRFCPWCGASKAKPVRHKYDELPLGARFNYIGHADYGVWVKLENGRTGVIAKWGDGEVGWRQSICSLCDTEEERKTFVVEVIE